MPFAERLRIVVAWSAVALVAWRAPASVRAVLAELGGRSLEQRMRALDARPEELIRARLGADFAIWQALRECLPSDARVLVSFRDQKSTLPVLRRRLVKLGTLVYPLVLQSWPFDPEHPAVAPPAPEARRAYVLDLESGRDFSLWPLCEELARGEHFRLLLVWGGAG